MSRTKVPYRVWLRGAFPQRTPQYFDALFYSVPDAAAEGIRRSVASCAVGQPLPGFTKVAVHKIVEGKVNPTPSYTWSAGE